MVTQPAQIYEFGSFRLDLTDHLLLKEGKPVALTPKAFEVLVCLIGSRGRLILKNELMSEVWAGSFVEEANLARTVWMLRKALDSDHGGKSYIETVPKLGYRFVAEVTENSSEEAVESLDVESAHLRYRPNGTNLSDDFLEPAADEIEKGSATRTSIWQSRNLFIFAITLVATSLLTSVYFLRARNTSSPSETQIHSLAVLPLENLSGDTSQEYLAVGMTEGLIASLSRAKMLRVTAPKSAMQYKTTSGALPGSANELGVDVLVVGSFVNDANGVRVEARMVDAATGTRLWSNSYARSVSDVWALQNEIAREITGKLGLKTQEGPDVELQVNPGAYDLYLRGRFRVGDNNPKNMREAIDLQEQATKQDPNFALAWAELARVCSLYAFLYTPQEKKWQEEAFVAVEQANRLNPELPEAHLARGSLLWTQTNAFPHEQAIQEYRRALELNPSLDEARYQLGRIYMHIGLFDKAIAEYQLALAINPALVGTRMRLAVVANFQGKYEESLNMQDSLPPELDDSTLHYQKAWSLCHLKRYDEAASLIEVWRKSDTKDEEGGLLTSMQALLAAHNGNEKETEMYVKLTGENGSKFGHFHHSAYTIAEAYSVLNRPEKAMKWLQFAADNGFPNFPLFSNDPELDNVRPDPRFIDFMQNQKEHWDTRMKTL